MIYHCCTDSRRTLIKTKTNLNGIDYLEVKPTDIVSEKQKTIQIRFIRPLTVPLSLSNILIKEGDKITNIVAENIDSTIANDTIEVKLSDRGNFSMYTFCLRKDQIGDEFLPEFDVLLASVDFSFKAACDSDIDCKPEGNLCIDSDDSKSPEINYLAKDYASFKQLMLDRMSFLIPNWTERNAADLGITLVEQLAYVSDHLSYRQDAISTEAYLGTSRKRISVRRHARLVDYHMHDGLNARAWVNIEIKPSSDGVELKRTMTSGKITKFLANNADQVIQNHKTSYNQFLKTKEDARIVFEPMHDLQLFKEHNKISFHTYGESDCCLPKGAMHATLKGSLNNLRVGHVLIFQEVLGPETGEKSDADPNLRHVIRITKIERKKDFDFSGSNAAPIDITIIHWSREDALPFPLCVSNSISKKNAIEVIEVSLALGNILLVDHGLSQTDEDGLMPGFPFENVTGNIKPSQVPNKRYDYAGHGASDRCATAKKEPVYPRYNPIIEKNPITQSESLELEKIQGLNTLFLPINISAKELIVQNERKGTPDLTLYEIISSGASYTKLTDNWIPVQDLLIDSDSLDQHFVLEIESGHESRIRFGNNVNGKKPESGSKFIASYRVGNGTEGNVGRDSIRQIVYDDSLDIINISNPLSAFGGIEPETKEEVRQYAPQAFRTQERAVTSEDYVTMTRRCYDDIQSATASFRWTGSWRTAYITADRLDGMVVTQEWEDNLKNCLEKYRMAGVDLEIDDPHYIGLDIEMEACLLPDYFKIDIRREILRLFSNKVLDNGKLGVFHPDNFTFGESIYLSQIYAMAQNIEGVASVKITKFERQGIEDSSGLADGRLTFGRQEIVRLDNDPNFKDHGVFHLILKGGR